MVLSFWLPGGACGRVAPIAYRPPRPIPLPLEQSERDPMHMLNSRLARIP